MTLPFDSHEVSAAAEFWADSLQYGNVWNKILEAIGFLSANKVYSRRQNFSLRRIFPICIYMKPYLGLHTIFCLYSSI